MDFFNTSIFSLVLFLSDLQVVEDMSAVACGKHWVGIRYKFSQPNLCEDSSIFTEMTFPNTEQDFSQGPAVGDFLTVGRTVAQKQPHQFSLSRTLAPGVS